MSLLNDLFNLGKGAFNFFTGPSIGASLAKTAITGYALKKVTNSINKDNARKSRADAGSRVQVNPDTEQKIPVVYGSAILGGSVTDAVLSPDNKTMWFVITLCEQTGALLSNNAASKISFEKFYWNDLEILFQANGVTVSALRDSTGAVDNSINGLVEIYCYSGNSSLGVKPQGFSGAIPDAREVVPNWTDNHTMNDLIFAVVEVSYNKEKNITNLGNINFKLTNTMTQPGDCLFDYMTNPRYGAGLDPAEIYGI